MHVSHLGAFFKGSDTRLGVFYPHHTLIAIFPGIDRAETAKQQLRGAGFSEDEVVAASGGDLVELVHEESARSGLFGYLVTELSRFLNTEATYTDHDLARAKRGAALLAVHCGCERTKNAAWRLVAPTEPLAARYYALDGIEHLAGEV
jgi:hypothetical protein